MSDVPSNKDHVNINALYRQVELRFVEHEYRIAVAVQGQGLRVEVYLPRSQLLSWRVFEPDGSETGFGYQVFKGTYDIMDRLDDLIREQAAAC